MDFSWSPEHEQLRQMVRAFSQQTLVPHIAESEESETFPKELFRVWAKQGLLGVRYPEADGGAGLDKVADCIVREEISRVWQAFASAWSAHTHVALWPIWKAGTLEQKHRYLKPGLNGEVIGAFALSEPDIGSDTRALKTRAERVSGGWKLSGGKLYITNAPFADFLLLAARTRPELVSDSISFATAAPSTSSGNASVTSSHRYA